MRGETMRTSFLKPATGTSDVAGLVLLPVFAIAQSQNAELTGTITDPTGGLVPGAQVTAANVNHR